MQAYPTSIVGKANMNLLGQHHHPEIIHYRQIAVTDTKLQTNDTVKLIWQIVICTNLQ